MEEKVEFYKEKEFKDTEIGRIPKEWEAIRFGDIVNLVKGRRPREFANERVKDSLPYLSVENLRNNNIVQFVKVSGDIILVDEGDLVLIWDGSNAGEFFLGKRGVLSSTMVKILLREKLYDGKFLFYLLKTKENYLKGQTKGTGIPHVDGTILRSLVIPLPPSEEQQKIAEILSTVDEAIQKTDDTIAKTERLKKGLMQELLTKGIGHKEFKDTEIGRIPKEWKTSNLGEVSYLIMGQSPPSKTYNRDMIGLPFLQGQKDFGDIYPNPSVYCSKPIKIAEEGDVLVSVRAPVGDINIATSKLCIGRGLAAIRPDKNQLDAKFIFYQLKHFSARLVDLGSGSTFKEIRRNDLERFPMVLPPLSEQQKIASVLSTVDEKLETLKQEKVKLERIKQWFMEELLTGRIRVRVA